MQEQLANLKYEIEYLYFKFIMLLMRNAKDF